MTIHVNIGEAKTRLSELVAASLRGEEVVLNRAGKPVLRFVPDEQAVAQEREAIAARRKAMFGKHAGKFTEEQLTVPDEPAEEYEDTRFVRKFGYPPPA